MNKADLIDSIIAQSGLGKSEVAKVLEAYSDIVTKTLQSGDQIVIPGLGTFCVSNRAARTGRNPRTGEALEIPATRVPKFKPAKALKEAVAE
jgi:DNA-binding protein HU-beta